MLRLLVIALLSLTPLQAEQITRAYFVGSNQLEAWTERNNMLLMSSGRKKAAKLAPLKKLPFSSPHFNANDTLYDFKAFALFNGIQPLPTHATYNQTSGRLVVQGDEASHNFFKSVAVETFKQLPVTLALKVEILQSDTLILTTDLKADPGQETNVTLSDANHELAVSWEAHTDSRLDLIDARFQIDGHVNEQNLTLKIGTVAVVGLPQVIDLGMASPDQAPLELRLTGQVLLPGGISILETILDEKGNPTDILNLRAEQISAFHQGIVDPKTGKILRSYNVTPSFKFIHWNPSASGGEEDPFSEHSGDRPTTHGLTYLTDWDPRIPAPPLASMVNFKWLLANTGVEFDNEDYAILNEKTDTLYVLANKAAHELTEGITRSHVHLPRLIKADFQLIETAEKPSLKTLTNEPTVLAKTSTITLPGQTSTTILGAMQLELEAQIDANDSLIEARHIFQLVEGDHEPTFYHRSGLVYESGVPQIIQTTYLDGKWQSLVVTATSQSPFDSILEK